MTEAEKKKLAAEAAAAEAQQGLTISLKNPAFEKLSLWQLAQYLKDEHGLLMDPDFVKKKVVYEGTKFADIPTQAIKIGVMGSSATGRVTVSAKNGAPEFDVQSDNYHDLRVMLMALMAALKKFDLPLKPGEKRRYDISFSRCSEKAKPELEKIRQELIAQGDDVHFTDQKAGEKNQDAEKEKSANSVSLRPKGPK